MPTAVIVDAIRTAGGKRHGNLSGWHPADLAGEVLKALAERNHLDPALVEDVIMGCFSQIGAQGYNVARTAVLAAGFPETVPGTTVDRQCGSSQQAVHFAAQAVMAGQYEVVIAAGVEVMSLVAMGSTVSVPGLGLPFGPYVEKRYEAGGGLVPQGISAELIAQRWGLSREGLDLYSTSSHHKAAKASAEGRFEQEILPLVGKRKDKETGTIATSGDVVAADEGIQADCSAESLGLLPPAFKEGGVITAGNSSQITDGASAVLIMSEERASSLGLVPRARFHAFALAGVDPQLMLTAPIPATTKVLERAKLTLDDIDVVEINEAFAAVVLAWEAEHHPDMSKVNVNGGAIALGHPLGASGTKLLATLVNELERTGGRWGLQTMCEGGGMANATIIERLG